VIAEAVERRLVPHLAEGDEGAPLVFEPDLGGDPPGPRAATRPDESQATLREPGRLDPLEVERGLSSSLRS